MDDREGLPRALARAAFGAAKSVKDTVTRRELTTVRWSPRRNAWVHRWPDGRAVADRRWRTSMDWATVGTNYDMDDLLWRHYRPRSGDTVVDVGAGHGGETYFLASMVGGSGRVLAVEAAPGPFGELADLVRLNGWDHVEPLQVALSDHAGEVLISEDDNWIEANVYSDKGIPVRATTFDEICAARGITMVDWVKMNIEGAEKDALRGMEEMAPHVRHLTIACHDFLGTEWGRSMDQVLAWLDEHGFETKIRGEGDPWESHYVYAWRRP